MGRIWKLWIAENKGALVAAGVVFLLVSGALITAEHYARRSEELTHQAQLLEGQIAEKESQRLEALNLLDEARLWSEASNARVKELEGKLALKPKPPKPAPAPATSLELEQVIVKFGLMEGLVVLEEAKPSVLGRSDALKAYEWASQAARVAPLEDRVDAQEALIGGLKEQVAARDGEIRAAGVVIKVTTEELGLSRKQVDTLQKEAKTSARKAWIQKWLYAGGAAMTGYLIGKGK